MKAGKRFKVLAMVGLAALAPSSAWAEGGGAAAALEATRPPKPPTGREVLPGPVSAAVVRVIDGDTLMVRARIWVGQDLEIKVRLADIDTPELRGRCEREKELARRARELVKTAVASGTVRLSDIQYGKYAGRVVARVDADSGGDLARQLIGAGLGRAYGGGKRVGWCG